MFEQITFYLIGGIPFIVYFGIVVFILFFITALIAYLRNKGKTKIRVQWHHRFAYTALIFGAIHLILGAFAYI